MCAVMFVSEGAVSAKLLAQLLWGPLPDVLPTPEWRLSRPPDDPAMASDADTDSEAGKALVDRRVRARSVQAVVRKAYLGTLAEQERERRPPAAFAQAWRAHLVGLLAQESVGPPGRAPITMTGPDLDLAWRLYELTRRARQDVIERATTTPSRGVQRGRRVPTFEFSIVSEGESLGDVTYGICRSCGTGMLYQIEFAPDWQFCGFGRLALGQLEVRHPDLTWYTTGQFQHARGFYERYRQGSTSPWTDAQQPCPHFD
jgi:hypothetical protein